MNDQQDNSVSDMGQKRGIKFTTEGEIYNYFLNKGYSVVQGKFISSENGIPDFQVKNKNDLFYVEVKDVNGILSMSQIEWMVQHKEKTYLAIKNVSGTFSFFEINLKEVKL